MYVEVRDCEMGLCMCVGCWIYGCYSDMPDVAIGSAVGVLRFRAVAFICALAP